jgi:creatinine amidohydrolase
MTAPSSFIAELTWKEFQEAAAQQAQPILLPMGSTEQHGLHLPLNTDQLLPTEVCRRVTMASPALIAPTLTYGYKSQQRAGGGNWFPGTLSLDGATLIALVKTVLLELARHGVRRFCIVNGHYENSWFLHEAVDLALKELRWDGVRDARIVLLSYWDFIDPQTISKIYPDGFSGMELEHAGVMETSMMLAAHPNLVKLDRAVDHPPAKFPVYDVYPPRTGLTPKAGSLTSPKRATAEKGALLLEVASRGIAQTLVQEFGAA